jgi:hypothetical protein
MSIAARFAWIPTVFGGLVLLMIWIIEYDSEFQGSAATRLPVPVISTHALLGMGGLALWFSYILIDQDRLAWASVAVVGTAAVLGLAMAARWVRVYRSFARPAGRHHHRPGAVHRARRELMPGGNGTAAGPGRA